MIIKSVREFIKQCPYLSEFAKGINVDYLAENSTAYSIEEVPCDPIIKRYVDGSSVREFQFIFASRESYGADVFQNIDNCGFYESFANWLEKESLKGNLPLLENKESRSIQATTNGYAFQTDVDKARYQIQCSLVYYQKGGL